MIFQTGRRIVLRTLDTTYQALGVIMGHHHKPAEKDETVQEGIKFKTAPEISNSSVAAKRRRHAHGMRAAALLYVAENLAPSSQQWLFFLVLIHTLGDFEISLQLFSFLHAIIIWLLPGVWMLPSYLSVAIIDRLWHPNREADAEKLSIRYFMIAWGIYILQSGFVPLWRQFVNIEA
jgi:hypothetical protein